MVRSCILKGRLTSFLEERCGVFTILCSGGEHVRDEEAGPGHRGVAAPPHPALGILRDRAVAAGLVEPERAGVSEAEARSLVEISGIRQRVMTRLNKPANQE